LLYKFKFATSRSRTNEIFRQIQVYGLHLRVLIVANANEPTNREYRSLYSRYTGRMSTDSVSHAVSWCPKSTHAMDDKFHLHVYSFSFIWSIHGRNLTVTAVQTPVFWFKFTSHRWSKYLSITIPLASVVTEYYLLPLGFWECTYVVPMYRCAAPPEGIENNVLPIGLHGNCRHVSESETNAGAFTLNRGVSNYWTWKKISSIYLVPVSPFWNQAHDRDICDQSICLFHCNLERCLLLNMHEFFLLLPRFLVSGY
jgi:hypothetical protein